MTKGGGQKKRFQYCLKPDEPEGLLYLRVLLPMNCTKYVYHIGHGNELRSIVRNGLIPGGFSTNTGRYAVFFTVIDPMGDRRGLRKTFCDLS